MDETRDIYVSKKIFPFQLTTTFPDVPASVLYDVLHDPSYRTTWDKFMLETREIGHLNPNNNLNYYAREFCFLLCNA